VNKKSVVSITSIYFVFSFSAHTTYNVEGIITAAPTRVAIVGISPKIHAPTAADHMSSVYRNGARAEASRRLNDFKRQNKSRLAPAPRMASRQS
jgi:hypothetical protein